MAMRKHTFLISAVSLIVLISITSIPLTKCLPFYMFVWNPEESRVNIKLNYPKEAHRGDIIAYVLDVFWWEDELMNEFNFYINYARDDGTWHTLFSTNLFTDVNMGQDEERHYSFEVEIPLHASYFPYNMEVNFAIRTDNSPLMDILSIYSTRIVEKTRTELQSENSELSYNYSSLHQQFDTYEDAHSYSNNEYDTLNSTYSQYVDDHAYTNSEYNGLESDYNRQLSVANTLSYILISIAIGLGASTVYLAIRKPKKT